MNSMKAGILMNSVSTWNHTEAEIPHPSKVITNPHQKNKTKQSFPDISSSTSKGNPTLTYTHTTQSALCLQQLPQVPATPGLFPIPAQLSSPPSNFLFSKIPLTSLCMSCLFPTSHLLSLTSLQIGKSRTMRR